MNIEKEVLALWKEVCPESAYENGLLEYAGQTWIPSHHNIKKALSLIAKLRKKADTATSKWLSALERSIVFEEAHHAPGHVMSVFFIHLIMKAKEKDYLLLAEQCIHYLGVSEHLWEKKWPLEIQIYSKQSCDGAISILETVKKKCKNTETKEAITSLQKRIKMWGEKTSNVKLKKNDFSEIFPLIENSTQFNRKETYPLLLKDFYDYPETAQEIEEMAVSWIDYELPRFNFIVEKLAKRYKCAKTVEAINSSLEKHQKIPLAKLVETTKKLRAVLQKLAHELWVEITPKYDVRLIETPPYLVPFLPTAAMQPFGSMKKPFCISFLTTDKKASPSTFLPGVLQTLIHEEYGHCVNFMNSYLGHIGKLPLVCILDSSLSTPITEGISFFRELEALDSFREIEQRAKTKIEKNVVQLIEKYCTFSEFVDGYEFEVMQWRMARFLRAICDSRVNSSKQPYAEFIEWGHEKTGLSKKLIFDQTFHFLENPGYAPCYSIFGQRLRELQKLVHKKGFSQKEFNTFVASSGFPARTVFEEQLKKKFGI